MNNGITIIGILFSNAYHITSVPHTAQALYIEEVEVNDSLSLETKEDIFRGRNCSFIYHAVLINKNLIAPELTVTKKQTSVMFRTGVCIT